MKIRKELWFGFSLMGIVVIGALSLLPWGNLATGHLGLLMLALIVVAIMLGFPTAFTLMGMGVFFGWLAYRDVNPELATRQILDLMVQRTYAVMANDVLIAVPLFVFMGYLVERAALIDRLFKSLHLATARLPGSLAVATIITCAVFATATGIVGAVVTLMGLLAFPAMLRAGYHVQIGAGSITAGGCLGILIPPSVLLIVYGATAGVSVVQLYAGALFPGLMLASLYIGYVILLAMLKPKLMPRLSVEEARIELPAFARALAPRRRNALAGLFTAAFSASSVPRATVFGQLFVSLIPALVLAGLLVLAYRVATAPPTDASAYGFEVGTLVGLAEEEPAGLIGAPELGDEAVADEEGAEPLTAEPAEGDAAELEAEPAEQAAQGEQAAERTSLPRWFWTMLGIATAALALLYSLWSWERFQLFKMLLTSFFPLAMLILSVLGSIMFGLATPAEAAAVGAFGGFLLTLAYRFVQRWRGAARRAPVVWQTAREVGGIVKESAFLTAKTSAMVCWLFVGSSIFSASFALLGGQDLIERWVLSLDMTPVQFMILAQVIIFLLGWPLEWTEIIVIFMPIFVPLLAHFDVNPLFFGLMVALNLQTAFLSPPVAMSAFYLKGVAPPHVTLNQIFLGMMPFMGIQVIAMVLLYSWPQIGLWLPSVLYAR